jgi:hypothetical protein
MENKYISHENFLKFKCLLDTIYNRTSVDTPIQYDKGSAKLSWYGHNGDILLFSLKVSRNATGRWEIVREPQSAYIEAAAIDFYTDVAFPHFRQQ